MSLKISNKEKLKEWKREQKNAFEKSLPFPRRIFEKLMEFLDIKLGRNSCKDDYQLTKQYLSKCGIQIEDHIYFFMDHGGHCDCEILANLDELFEPQELEEPFVFTESDQPKPKSKTEKLKNINLADFKITKIPKPWKLIKKGNRYEFRLGKSDDIIIKKMKKVSDKKWSDVSFWFERRNQLNRNEEEKNEVIYTDILIYELVIVKSHRSLSYVWIRSKKPNKWMLQLQTSIARLRSDLESIKILLNEIED